MVWLPGLFTLAVSMETDSPDYKVNVFIYYVHGMERRQLRAERFLVCATSGTFFDYFGFLTQNAYAEPTRFTLRCFLWDNIVRTVVTVPATEDVYEVVAEDKIKRLQFEVHELPRPQTTAGSTTDVFTELMATQEREQERRRASMFNIGPIFSARSIRTISPTDIGRTISSTAS